MTAFFSLHDKSGQNNPILSSILSTICIYIYLCIHPIAFIASLEEQEKVNTHNEKKKKKRWNDMATSRKSDMNNIQS
jgi:shikimate kinase